MGGKGRCFPPKFTSLELPCFFRHTFQGRTRLASLTRLRSEQPGLNQRAPRSGPAPPALPSPPAWPPAPAPTSRGGKLSRVSPSFPGSAGARRPPQHPAAAPPARAGRTGAQSVPRCPPRPCSAQWPWQCLQPGVSWRATLPASSGSSRDRSDSSLGARGTGKEGRGGRGRWRPRGGAPRLPAPRKPVELRRPRSGSGRAAQPPAWPPVSLPPAEWTERRERRLRASTCALGAGKGWAR